MNYLILMSPILSVSLNHGIDASRYWVLEEVLGKRDGNQDMSGIFSW